MAYGRSEEAINWDHMAHILRDVFPGISSHVVNFNEDQSLSFKLREPQHSIEAWGLVVPTDKELSDKTQYWLFDVNKPYYGNNFCKLFLSFNYNPPIHYSDNEQVAYNIYKFMKVDGSILLVNPGPWAAALSTGFKRRSDLEHELKLYTMLSNENVVVYQK